MASNFPTSVDTDLQLPRVDNAVTEVTSESINSIRDAVLAIQKAIGVNPQGNKASLTERINVSIDANGLLKRSAMDLAGLATLPIMNVHVGTNAGIVESKLALDFSTLSLKNLLDSLRSSLNNLSTLVSSGSSSFNKHYLGQEFQHDGYQILINKVGDPQIGVAGLAATTIGDAINELSYVLFQNIDMLLGGTLKHRAADISVDTTNFTTLSQDSQNVQEVFDNLDIQSDIFGKAHGGNFHSNGILREIGSGTTYNTRHPIITDSFVSYTAFSPIVTFPLFNDFNSFEVGVGDILLLTTDGYLDQGGFQIRSIGPQANPLGGLPVLDSNQMAVFHIFQETDAYVPADVYGPASDFSELAPLACAVRPNSTITDSIAIAPPNAARAVSLGFNSSIIQANDGYDLEVEVGLGPGVSRSLEIPYLGKYRLTAAAASPVTATSVAERINAYVSDPTLQHHFPITAYAVGNEVALAHNWEGADYYIKIRSSGSGNYAMGFSSYGANLEDQTIYGNLNNDYVINGTSSDSLSTLVSGHVTIVADSDTFTLLDVDEQTINPQAYGVTTGMILNVLNHPTAEANGSYVILSVTSTTLSVFASDPVVASGSTTFDFSITASTLSLDVLQDAGDNNLGIVQVYADSEEKTWLHERARYATLDSTLQIIDLSDNFPEETVTIDITGSNPYTFSMTFNSLPGVEVTISNSFVGRFKLYHPNNLDYVIIKKTSGNIVGAGSTSLIVSSPLIYKEALLLANAHFDGSLTITSLTDKRLFGNLGVAQLRDDVVDLVGQRPVAELRSNGVARGFDLLNAPYEDSIAALPAIPISGGVAYVGGVRVVVETQNVIIPVSTDGYYVVGINEFGSIQALSDSLSEVLDNYLESSSEFGKVTPLYYVGIAAGAIQAVIDIRLFINNIDEKLDLIVDQTGNLVGNFQSLEGALVYAQNYPGSEKLTIRIVNEVTLSGTVIVPDGVSLVSNSAYGGGGTHRIVCATVPLDFPLFILQGNNRIENLNITAAAGANKPILSIAGNNVEINQCSLTYDGAISTNSSDFAIRVEETAESDVTIKNNIINGCFVGIESAFGCERLTIKDNKILDLSGTGGESFGISLGNVSLAQTQVLVTGNSIIIPSVVLPTDIRGINFNITNDVLELRIENNNIIHESQNIGTYGINVDMVSTGAEVASLFVSGNIIDGVKLVDNNVYGIYVDNVENATISHNIIKNVGAAVVADLNNPRAGIYVGENVAVANVFGNTLQDCVLDYGVYIANGSTVSSQAVLSRNIFKNLSTTARYVYFNTLHGEVSDNILVGPGAYGIICAGAHAKISNNNLSNPEAGTDYAFSTYGIQTSASFTNISGNSITGMDYTDGDTGILGTDGSTNLKITDNIIEGTTLKTLIHIYGTGHQVANNILTNTTAASTDTVFIKLDTGCANSSITNNHFYGQGTSGITNATSATAIDSVYFEGNNLSGITSYSGSSAVGPIYLVSDSVVNNQITNCVFIGNTVPLAGGANVIGIVPTAAVKNSNVIGINRGLADTLTLPFAAGISGYNASNTTPDWRIATAVATGFYWQANNTAAVLRRLVFPITGLPNGAKLTGARIMGSTSTAANTTTAYLYKQSISSATFASSSLGSLLLATGSGSLVYFDSAATFTITEEIINYYEDSYFLLIENSADSLAAGTDAADTRIYAATINFTY